MQNYRLCCPADHRIKLKECEKKDKDLDLIRGLKKLWNMQVTIIPIVIGAFGTVTKGLLKGLEWKQWGPNQSLLAVTESPPLWPVTHSTPPVEHPG